MKAEFIAPESLLRDNMVEVRSFKHENYSKAAHSHEFYEIEIVLKGTGTHAIEDNSLKIVAGDVFVIPPFIVHSYENTKDLTVQHVLFSRETIDNGKKNTSTYPGFLHFTEIEPYLRGRFSAMRFLHLSQSEEHTSELQSQL